MRNLKSIFCLARPRKEIECNLYIIIFKILHYQQNRAHIYDLLGQLIAHREF